MRESKFTVGNPPCRRTIQVLQFVVLNSAVGITIVMMMMVVVMRSVPGDGNFGKGQLTFGYMGRVLAQ